MCPIHDTDSSEERWSKAEWEHYELWEKKEAKIRSQKRWIMLAGLFVFLVLSAIPIVVDRSSQWRALRALREMASHINRVKREAASHNQAMRVSVDLSEPLLLRVESGTDCKSPDFKEERRILLIPEDAKRDTLTWLEPLRGQEIGIPGLLLSFCYDPLKGSSVTPGEDSLAGFAILPVKELTQTPERHAVLLLRGPSAEISFE
jgi:hypothetical protein